MRIFLTPDEIALERYQIIRPCLSEGASREEIARAAGLTSRTIRLWIGQFNREGLPGLRPHIRKDAGGRRKIVPELAQVIEGLCLRTPPLPVTAIHRSVLVLCQKNKWRAPSYDVVHDICSKISRDIKTLAHEGPSAYEQAFELLHRHEAEAPNEVWQADHAQLDILIFDSNGRAMKPWLTAALDDFSRAVPGYYLGFEPPCSMRIAMTLRQSIWRKEESAWSICGIPDKFYSDRGTDFMSKHIDQVSIDLKFELLNTLPQKPRGKGKMERFFETVAQLFLTDQPGYAPKGYGKVDAVLKLQELDERFRQWLVNDYLQREHSEIGCSPKSRWESKSFVPRLPDTKEELDILLLTVTRPRKVHRGGIRFQGFRYFDISLSGYIGEEVTIRFDPRDLAEILVYADNALVCRAVCFELSDKRTSLKEVIRARSAKRREVRESLTDLLQIADKYVPREKPSLSVVPIVAAPEVEYPKFKIKRFACDE